jgi:hypothetical protein
MTRQTEVRPVIKLRSTAGTGYTYVTRKNRGDHSGRLLRADAPSTISVGCPVAPAGSTSPEVRQARELNDDNRFHLT